MVMTMTCNFDKDNYESPKNDKIIVRLSPGQITGADTPASRPIKHGAYLWVLSPRRRSGKSWRDNSSIN